MDERLAAELLDAVAARREELIELTQALVRERSLLGAEAGAQRLLAQRLAQAGFAVSEVEIQPPPEDRTETWGYAPGSYDGRTCVVGRIDGAGSGRSLHLSGHIDVVPVESPERWEHDPWGGACSGGRIWGRGAGDMKAGIAAYLIAAETFLGVHGPPRGDLLFSSVIEEECTGNGMKAVLAAGWEADGTLIGEPSELTLLNAGVGVIWARLRSLGSGAHVAWSAGGSSSERILAAIDAARELERSLNARPDRSPAAGEDLDAVFLDVHERPFRLNVGTLAGGVWPSSEPACVEARVRLGFGRSLTPAQAQRLLAEAVRARVPDVEVIFEGFRAPAYCDDLEHDLARTLSAAHERLHGIPPQRRALPGTTDARSVSGPCVCYGPLVGSIHAVDEWVDIDSMASVAGAVALTIAHWQEDGAAM